MQEINEKRERLGKYHRLCVELQSHEDRFLKYFRMSRACFEEMHDLLRPRIVKYTTNWRRPILPPCRAARLANLSATHNCPQPAAF